jgi:hypothetical protein
MLVKGQRYRAALLPLPLMFLPKALSKKYRRLVDKNNQSKPPTQKKKIDGNTEYVYLYRVVQGILDAERRQL